MDRRLLVSVLVLLSFTAVPARATCYKCRADTSGGLISCYMAEGNKAWCTPVGTSGCVTGGVCLGGSEGECGERGQPPCEISTLARPEGVCPNIDRPARQEYVLAEVIVVHVPVRAMVASLPAR